MKMKFALLFLPALMALSSCNAAAQPAPEKTFLEDTTAHSEIFGGNDVFGGNLQIKDRAKGEAITAPKIGYQIKYADDKLAIRFVAAVKEFNVKAYWRRGIAGADGSELRSKSFANDGKEVTKYYTSLSDGNTTITAGSGDYVGYEGFVVFSIYNIPYSSNKNAYVAAYLNLVGDEDGDSEIHNNSKALAVKIERKSEDPASPNSYKSNNVFAFNPTISDMHFLEGTIGGALYDGGTNGLYERSDPARKGDGNNAWYENIQLKAGDSFGSFYYDHDRIFQYFGYSTYFDTTTDFNESSLSGFASPKKEGKYNLYISEGVSNHVYSNRLAYHVTFYVDTTEFDGWTPNAGYNYFIHAFKKNVADYTSWDANNMSLVTGEEHLRYFVLEMAVANSIDGVIFGLHQGSALKKTDDISCSISDTGAYDITKTGWNGDNMTATISAHV